MPPPLLLPLPPCAVCRAQVLVATSTLAWGINMPAHLVVVKGTEYFDGKTKRYVDFPITDVIQMMGRAGRPQFDDEAVAVVLVHDIKKHFYKKFMFEPFPVESSLADVLPDHFNAEIVAGTIASKQVRAVAATRREGEGGFTLTALALVPT